MNEYEEQRLENIRRNQQLLKELQLSKDQLQQQGRVIPQQVNLERKPIKRKRDSAPVLPTRSSARLADIASNATSSRPISDDNKSSNSGAQSLHHSRPTKPSTGRSKASIEKSITKIPTNARPPSAAALKAITDSWIYAVTAPPPSRDNDDLLHFSDFPDFTPNLTPEEVLRSGCFGGTYFRPLWSKKLSIVVRDDWHDLPESWVAGLDKGTYLTSETYDPLVNKYGVACGQSIEEWEAQGWIDHRFDPRGWFQWYARFYLGRRCEDDERQVGRWKKCCGETGRWRRTLLKKYAQAEIRTPQIPTSEDEEDKVKDVEEKRENENVNGNDGVHRIIVSPVIHQTCHHWGFKVTQKVLDDYLNSL